MNKLKLYFGNALVVEHRGSAHPTIVCQVTATVDGFSVTGEGDMVYKLPDDKMIHVKVTYVDAKGREAEVDGDVTWASSDETIAKVEVDPSDSKQAKISAADQLGQAQVTATADADIGDGVQELICTMDVEVVGGQAVAGVITPVGEPEPIGGDEIDNTLPGSGRPSRPDNSLPGQGRPPRPDNSLPGGGRPDNSLPPGGRVDNTLPEHPAPKYRR